MAEDLRKKVVIRKVIYLGVILGLFTLSMFWRGVFELPIGNPNYITQRDETTNEPVKPTALDRFARLSIKHQAEDHELRELDLGDAEIAGAVFQVSLVGSRGAAVTILWREVIRAQTRGEYQLMQFYSKLVTRLQPHFIEPWIFQAWNIAYNVSVETDQLSDAYYYIASGVNLLAEGDRINTRTHRRGGEVFVVGSPDIRHQIGFYLQNKFTVSDKVNTFRSFASLSLIPPAERDAKKLTLDGTTTGRVDPRKFHDFCERNPQLVRRLKTYLKYTTREQVVDFLAANKEIPSRFDLNSEPLSDEQAFPIFPKVEQATQPKLFAYIKGMLEREPDGIDILQASRAWFAHSQAVVPPAEGRPDAVPEVYDQFRYRIPTRPALIVFRSTPPRAQTYLADRLQKEGWFDANSSWDPDAAVDEKAKWFNYAPKPGEAAKPVKPLKSLLNSVEEWRLTNELWTEFGRENGLNESDRIAQENEAAVTRDILNRGNVFLRADAIDDEQLRDAARRNYKATKAITYYEQNRNVTNYQFFLDQSKFEMSGATAEVRQLLFNAQALHEQNRLDEEIAVRTQAAAQWRALIASPAHRKFYQNERADTLHEQTLDMEVTLAKLLSKDPQTQAKLNDAVRGAAMLMPVMDAPSHPILNRIVSEDDAQARIAAAYPSDELARKAKELIDQVKAKYPNTNPSDPATRRELVDTPEFGWMKTYMDSSKTDFWVKPFVRFQYLSKIGALNEGGNPDEAPTAPPGGEIPKIPVGQPR